MWGATQYENGQWIYPVRGVALISNPLTQDYNDVYIYHQYTDNMSYSPYLNHSWILNLQKKARSSVGWDINGAATLYYWDGYSHNYGYEVNTEWTNTPDYKWSKIMLKTWLSWGKTDEEDFCGVIVYFGSADGYVNQAGLYFDNTKFVEDWNSRSTQKAKVRFWR